MTTEITHIFLNEDFNLFSRRNLQFNLNIFASNDLPFLDVGLIAADKYAACFSQQEADSFKTEFNAEKKRDRKEHLSLFCAHKDGKFSLFLGKRSCNVGCVASAATNLAIYVMLPQEDVTINPTLAADYISEFVKVYTTRIRDALQNAGIVIT